MISSWLNVWFVIVRHSVSGIPAFMTSSQIAPLKDPSAWIGRSDGTWHPHLTDASGEPTIDLQEHLIGVRAARPRRKRG